MEKSCQHWLLQEKNPFRTRQCDGERSMEMEGTKKSHGIIPEIPKLECLCLNYTHINFKTKSSA